MRSPRHPHGTHRGRMLFELPEDVTAVRTAPTHQDKTIGSAVLPECRHCCLSSSTALLLLVFPQILPQTSMASFKPLHLPRFYKAQYDWLLHQAALYSNTFWAESSAIALHL